MQPSLPQKIERARKRLLQMHYNAHAGHIGPNLSILEAIMTLFHEVMNKDDRFILSKGHAAGALYVTLWSLGLVDDADLDSFCQDGTHFAGHPHGNLPSVMFPTGSLGHGPGLACGLALAAVQHNDHRRIWCLCGDGEWEEGSCWEALVFATHHRLDNITFMIDCNGLQGFDSVHNVTSIDSWEGRLASFGASVRTVNGHSPQSIIKALLPIVPGKPSIVLLETVKGRGLHNAGQVSCHYLPLSSEEYTQMKSIDEPGNPQ